MVVACVAARRKKGKAREKGAKVGKWSLTLSTQSPSLFPTQAIVVPPSLLNESS